MNPLNFDLHSHSTCSDGTLTPQALVARAAQRGVAMLALTDHDDTSGLVAARSAAAAHGIRLVDGVEISVTWRGHTIHIPWWSAGVAAWLRAGMGKISVMSAECRVQNAESGREVVNCKVPIACQWWGTLFTHHSALIIHH